MYLLNILGGGRSHCTQWDTTADIPHSAPANKPLITVIPLKRLLWQVKWLLESIPRPQMTPRMDPQHHRRSEWSVPVCYPQNPKADIKEVFPSLINAYAKHTKPTPGGKLGLGVLKGRVGVENFPWAVRFEQKLLRTLLIASGDLRTLLVAFLARNRPVEITRSVSIS